MSFSGGANAVFFRIRNLCPQSSHLKRCEFRYLCDNTDFKDPKHEIKKQEPSNTIEQILQNVKKEANSVNIGHNKRILNLAKPKFQRKEPIHQKRKINIGFDSEVSRDILAALKNVATDLKDNTVEQDLLQQLKSYSQETKEAQATGIEFKDIFKGMTVEPQLKMRKTETTADLEQQPAKKTQDGDGFDQVLDSSLGSESAVSDSDIQKVDADEQQNLSNIFTGMKIDQMDRTHPSEGKEATRKIKESMKLFQMKRKNIFNVFSGKPLDIFPASAEIEPDTTWSKLNERERKTFFTPSANNPFEEMIRWTEKGQLWPFPIDNDYGVTEEENVGFHEHVFIEMELESGFPKTGPIRLFMELVCLGLSKNPYITVSRKREHINWFRRYFKEKEHLLEVKSEQI